MKFEDLLKEKKRIGFSRWNMSKILKGKEKGEKWCDCAKRLGISCSDAECSWLDKVENGGGTPSTADTSSATDTKGESKMNFDQYLSEMPYSQPTTLLMPDKLSRSEATSWFYIGYYGSTNDIKEMRSIFVGMGINPDNIGYLVDRGGRIAHYKLYVKTKQDVQIYYENAAHDYMKKDLRGMYGFLK